MRGSLHALSASGLLLWGHLTPRPVFLSMADYLSGLILWSLMWNQKPDY
ncbi:MAG: hypothetical protein AB2693_23760 [Candidatus Thiodiazotropha sp.]